MIGGCGHYESPLANLHSGKLESTCDTSVSRSTATRPLIIGVPEHEFADQKKEVWVSDRNN